MDQWHRVTAVTLPFRNGSGLLLRLKGYGQTFPAPSEFEVHPHNGVAIFHRYPDDHHRGRFEAGNVTIEPVDGGDAVVASRDHRRTFDGLAKYRRWSPLDALYFFGYALCHYHVLPFTLAAGPPRPCPDGTRPPDRCGGHHPARRAHALPSATDLLWR
jgi:hypothetical protein